MNKGKNIFSGNIENLIEVLKNTSTKHDSELLSFAGEESKTEVLKKIKNGCPLLAAKYHKVADTVIKAATVNNSYQYDTEGLFFDVSTMLSGQPEYWLNEVEEEGQKVAKDFYLNLSAIWWAKEADIFCKLIKIVELIDSLEAAGQRLNLIVVYYADMKKNNKYWNLDCVIKTADQPVNIQQLVYLIASPIMLRYCAFTLSYNNGFNDDTTYNNYEAEIEEIKRTDIFYIPSLSHDVRNDLVPVNSTRHTINYTNVDLVKLYNISL